MRGLMLVSADVCVVEFYVAILICIGRNYYTITVEGLIITVKFEFVWPNFVWYPSQVPCILHKGTGNIKSVTN